MTKIGIAITEHNRPEAFAKSYENILKHAPKDAKIVVVDDASIIPVKEATYRFDTNVGIAKAKNKCFELLEDCEHIFLFDSDCWPIHEDWYKPYLESEHKHLMYIFKDFSYGSQLNDNSVEYQDNEIIAYTHPRGCMLYYHNDCLKTVGGMNPKFGKWGIDHLELSERIHYAGLTKYKFADVVGSNKLIYSMDEHKEVVTTVAGRERAKELKESFEVYNKVKGSANFMPYKPERNLILTCLFTTLVDPQRGVKWEYNPNVLDTLKNSVPDGVDFCSITDQFGYVPKHSNPYLAKWIAFKEYIEAHPEYDNIFCLDATDTEVLNNPFPHIERGKLYVGDEPGSVDNGWLINNHPNYADWIASNKHYTLLNAGICGGHRKILLQFLEQMESEIIGTTSLSFGLTDMALFNYTLRECFIPGIVTHGRQVNTVFKKFDKRGIYRERGVMKQSFFRHK